MKLESLTLDQCERVRKWRNAEMEVWRTPFMLTREMQIGFYNDIICDRNSNHRYWAIVRTRDEYLKDLHPMGEQIGGGIPLSEPYFVGMGGITYIQWENRIGEITLIIDPTRRGKGISEKAVDLLLDQAFNHLNLQTVFGECYECNAFGIVFWAKLKSKYNGYETALPNRKYYEGKYWRSLYFSIDKDDFNKKHNSD